MQPDLARLILRHRHVGPMLSALLTGTNAGVRITDEGGTVILEREAAGIGSERHPIVVEGSTLGWVDGDRVARSIAAVLSYACAREADKRSLAREALDRYRELNVVYELAEALSGQLDVETIAAIVAAEAGKLPAGGHGSLLLEWRGGIAAAVAASQVAEEVNDVAADPRASVDERVFAAVACAPVVARGQTIAILLVGSTVPVEYQSADLKLLSAIAAIAGPALAQARAHEAAAAGVG
jgi:hypothetical protein